MKNSTFKISNYKTVLIGMLLSILINTASAQTIIRVDRGSTAGNPNGTTWALAYPELPSALTLANSTSGPVQIWVKGTRAYAPTTGNDRSLSFVIARANMTIAGGFVGTETGFNQRNSVLYPTTLTGNIGTPATSQKSDNSHNVIKVTSGTVSANNTLLEGFTIQDGYGTLSGAGMSISDGFIKVSNCIFQNNEALGAGLFGGGVFCAGILGANTDNIFERCIFRGNRCGSFGGGVGAARGANFYSCLFYDNYAYQGGGGLSVSSADADVYNCTFTENTCSTNTGAVFLHGSAILFEGTASNTRIHRVTNSIFVGNLPFNNKQVIRPTNYGTYTHNLFEGEAYGLNVLTFNPGLALFGTGGGPYSVDKFCSQAYNVGTTFTGFQNELDLTGGSRMSKGKIDLGAYEYDFNSSSSVTVVITCAGLATGEIVIPYGGSGSQYYLDQTPYNGWGNNSSGRSFPNLAAGKYYAGIRQGGCTTIHPLDSATLVNPPVLSFSGFANPIRCNNYPTEVVVNTITGGYGSAQRGFRMDGGSNFFALPHTFSGLGIGVYTVTAFQGTCSRNYLLSNTTQPGAINVGLNNIYDAKCFGQNSGSIKILVSGAIPPYTYSISGISVFPTSVSGGYLEINNLSIGTKRLTVRDANGCTVNSNNFTINQPSAPLVGSLIRLSHISCNGVTNGVILATATGGTLGLSNYLYSIAGISTPTVNANTISGLASGTFAVVVSDFNNCKNTITGITITTPSALVASRVTTNNLCSGLNQGAITMSGTGGTLPYQYNMDGGTYQSARAFNGLFQGNYILRVKDANNCEAVTSANLSDPLPFGIAEQKMAPTCNGNTDGKLLITLTGGIGNKSTTVNGIGYSGNFTATGLTALQQYQLRIQDQNGCIDYYNTFIPEKETTTITGAVSKATCEPTTNDWILTLNANGGNGGFSYKIDNGVYTTNNVFSSLALSTIIGFAQDSKMCVTTITSVIVPSANPLNATLATKTDVLCFGATTGAISLNVSGGTIPYNFSINNSTFTGISILSNLGAGSKDVLIKDVNNCFATISGIIINQPTNPLTASLASKTDVLCFGNATGAISVNVSGGNSPYLYRVNNGVFADVATLSNLTTGTKEISVKDQSNCLVTLSGIVINQPASELSAIAAIENISSIKVTASGGTGAYAYILNSGSSQASNQFSNLTSGLYTIKITDANGCFKTIEQNVIVPTTLTGVSNSFSDNNIEIYPNPSAGDVNFKSKNTGILYIYDLNGSLVSEIAIQKETYNLSLSKNGLYLLRFVSNESVSNHKLIINK